ncbi:MAG: DUF3592 domain-containing protein [Pseudomonadota bacterium]
MAYRYYKPPIRLSRLFVRLGGLWVLVAGVLMMIGFLWLGASYDHGATFQNSAVATEATVVRRDIDRGSGNEWDKHYLFLDFDTSKGREENVRKKVSRSKYREFKRGATVTVYYLEKNPRSFQFSRKAPTNRARWMQVAIAILAPLWLMWLWLAGRNTIDGYLAVRHGPALNGRVSGAKVVGELNKKPFLYRITWWAEDGRRGTSLLTGKIALLKFPKDTEILLFRGKRRDWWADDVGTRNKHAGVPGVPGRSKRI